MMETRSGIREPERFADAVRSEQSITDEELDRDAARPPRIWLNTILRIVGRVFGVSRSDLRGTSQKHAFCVARFAYCYLSEIYRPDATLSQVKAVIRRDHTTVLSARRRARELLADNPDFRFLVEQCVPMIETWNPRNELDEANRIYALMREEQRIRFEAAKVAKTKPEPKPVPVPKKPGPKPKPPVIAGNWDGMSEKHSREWFRQMEDNFFRAVREAHFGVGKREEGQ